MEKNVTAALIISLTFSIVSAWLLIDFCLYRKRKRNAREERIALERLKPRKVGFSNQETNRHVKRRRNVGLGKSRNNRNIQPRKKNTNLWAKPRKAVAV